MGCAKKSADKEAFGKGEMLAEIIFIWGRFFFIGAGQWNFCSFG